ncbi:hypothetical protein QBC47DRAFT_54508 [Echria macrotheca]|uniref:Rhodopsin domain-containing protein n=1 Tax=Echria macrotheca TaxID=438768 RepID=A0AAJ0B7S1_9PEZI|nr:hypothetical protein QBC47DRAFT_54508 [Echria macrotheca]
MSDTTHDPAIDAQSRFGEIVSILSVFSGVTTAAVVLRCYARIFMLRCFGLDDGVMVAAQVLTIASAAAIGMEAHYGLGHHTWLNTATLVPYLKSFYASIVVYNIAVCLTKISILLQYKRLFAHRLIQRIILFGLCFLSAWAVALAFLLTLICQPVAAFWDSSINGKCIDPATVWYIMAGVNLVSDFTILTMPMPVLKSLQLPKRQKIMLIAVFCLGFFPCAISIYRIKTLRFAIDTPDPMFDNVDAATWSFLELTTGVLAACLPTLRPIFIAIMPRAFGASSLRSRAGQSGVHGTGHRKGTGPYSMATTNSTAQGSGRPPYRIKESESMEGLQRGGSSSGDEDIEFGALKNPGRVKTPAAYTVSVGVAADREKAGFDFAGRGIQTTTVVTQQVSSGKKLRK